MVDRVRWGIAGGGSVVTVKSGPAFARLRGGSLGAVVRRDGEAARRTAEALGAHRWYTSVEEMAADTGIDAVYVATPPGLHAEHARICLAHDLPVYLEKPIARNHAEARDLAADFREAGVPLFIAHYLRALPKFRAIKALLDQGAVGRVREIAVRLTRAPGEVEHHPWILNPALSGGGKFVDIAPHTLDILVFLFGPFAALSAQVSGRLPKPLEEVVALVFRTAGGAVGTAAFNLAAAGRGDAVRVVGEAGEMTFSIHGTEGVRLVTPDGERHLPDDPPRVLQEPMIQAVTDALLGHDDAPVCRAEEALETYRIIDAALAEFYGGRELGFWNRFTA
jgi:1,5-anhydro-D-fructose reductase (1,5-anhydro-D-mannitol-forming)